MIEHSGSELTGWAGMLYCRSLVHYRGTIGLDAGELGGVKQWEEILLTWVDTTMQMHTDHLLRFQEFAEPGFINRLQNDRTCQLSGSNWWLIWLKYYTVSVWGCHIIPFSLKFQYVWLATCKLLKDEPFFLGSCSTYWICLCLDSCYQPAHSKCGGPSILCRSLNVELLDCYQLEG